MTIYHKLLMALMAVVLYGVSVQMTLAGGIFGGTQPIEVPTR